MHRKNSRYGADPSPDHDLRVVAKGVIDTKSRVTYSGTTYLVSGTPTHNNSSAFSHQEGLGRFGQKQPEVFEVPESWGEVKLVINSVDGGPQCKEKVTYSPALQVGKII